MTGNSTLDITLAILVVCALYAFVIRPILDHNHTDDDDNTNCSSKNSFFN